MTLISLTNTETSVADSVLLMARKFSIPKLEWKFILWVVLKKKVLYQLI